MENFKDRLGTVLESLKGKSRIEGWQTEELFALHNYHFPKNKEHGKSCPPCRGRVFARMKTVWNQLEKE